ncbi:MAG: PBP1A family penicillin-binding protein, partial [bacterium]|nr:PBP1A family penicillin-binding protein [bacterium]
FVLSVSFVLISAFAVFEYIVYDLPKLDRVEDYRPPLTSRVFDSSGNLIAEFFTERRTLIPVQEIPEHVKKAFLAAEDANFYEHTGLDYLGILRAFINEVKYKIIGGQRIGGSTITQQTAKTMLLSRQRTYTRKIKEIILAKRIEDALTKDDILNLYLNQIYFGNGAYGIEEAAKTYYGVSARKLTLGQAAVLASVPKSPNRINPLKNPQRAQSRRNYVLEQMLVHGFISESKAEQTKREPIVTVTTAKPFLNQAPYYTEEIRRMLLDRFGEDEVYHGGLQIYTPVDMKLQIAAQKALKKGLRVLDKRQGFRGALAKVNLKEQNLLTKIFHEQKEKLLTNKTGYTIWDLSSLNPDNIKQDASTTLRSIKIVNLQNGILVAGLVKTVSNFNRTALVDLGTYNATLNFNDMAWARPFNPAEITPLPKLPSDALKTGDIIWVRIKNANINNMQVSLEQKPLVDGAVVVINPFNHRVLAMVGGYDFSTSSFNRATQAKRQPGSSFKPFIYAQAIDSEIVTAATLITDAPKVYVDNDKENQWKPRNDTGRFLGDITVNSCLRSSVNTCSITLLEKVGIDAVRGLAASTGILTEHSPLPRDLTLALGSGEVIPLSHINAFTIFPNQGLYAPPVLIEKVISRDGTVLFETAEVTETQVIKPETAFIITNIMRGLMRGGAKTITGIDATLAGKTGTTNDFRSAWFVGFSQDLVAGVYVGFDTNITLGQREYGSRAALPIWGYFMKEALQWVPAREFVQPEGVVWRLIDPKTGLLASPGAVYDPGMKIIDYEEESDSNNFPLIAAPQTVLEAFIAGTEPTMSATDSAPPPLELYDNGGLRP